MVLHRCLPEPALGQGIACHPNRESRDWLLWKKEMTTREAKKMWDSQAGPQRPPPTTEA